MVSPTWPSPKRARPEAGEPARRVVVVGAGRMGADIALAFALAGWSCDAVETAADVRRRAQALWRKELARLRAGRAAGRLRMHAGLDEVAWSGVDLVVETVTEDLRLKHRLLREIEPRVRASTLIVTNTSSLPIGKVNRVLARPARSAGLHFGMPAHVMPAVEITRGEHTSAATMKKLTGWMEAMGKVPVVLTRDVPGMIINRIQHAMYREIYHLIDTGVATPVDIDRAVRFGFGLRYPIIGPVMSRDIHGLPVHLAVARQLYPTLHNGRKPARVLSRLVESGKHGVRTGQGFYTWDPKTVDARLERFARLLEQSLKRLHRRGEPSEF